jgi:hypothetical protein
MSRYRPHALILAGLLSGCAGTQVRQPVELLDDRTGITVAALQRPVELTQREGVTVGKRPGFAYLGPVEWNRMGSFTQGLWLHLAPGQDQPLADLHDAATLELTLDDGSLTLQPAAPPALGREPYQPAVPWGQTAYYSLSVHDLRRLAASARLTLRGHAADGSLVTFTNAADPRPQLQAYVQSRALTGD